MNKIWDVYVYGDVNIDLVVPGVEALPEPGTEVDVGQMETFVGGGAALFTLGLAKLGVRTAFQGSVGRDMYGSYIRSLFRSLNIDDGLLQDSAEKKTGISISFTNEKDRCFLTYRGTNEGLSLSRMDLTQLVKARHVHITGYEGATNHDEYLNVIRRIHEIGDVSVSFDVGWDMTGAWYKGIFDLLPFIDVLFMNETECLHYTRCDDVLTGARLLDQYAKMAVIKLGSKGSLAVRDGQVFRAGSYRVQAVDTTGAGDSFNAGFIYAYLNGYPIDVSLRCANACGALSVTALGGNTAFPRLDELNAFMNEQKEGEPAL
ncbi:MAG: carbohydrate kinase family protein [Clostridia bacterium]|nr:carbohydrate kinase family protein [Clostridia bacterium]